MYEELKARLQDMVLDNHWTGIYVANPSLEAIEHLERQLAERDAEIAKYRDAPVVAWRYEWKAGEYTFSEKRYLDETYAPRLKPLIVKPGE